MNARALLRIAVASLLTAACGDRVQLGSNEGPPPPDDACVNVPCGQPCSQAPCTSDTCPPGGFCDLKGSCSLSMPLCGAPGNPCIGLPCGAPCNPCSGPCDECGVPCNPCPPDDASCNISTEPLTCDEFEQCQSDEVSCF